MITSNPSISKDQIFSKISSEYIYSHYLGNNYKVGKAISTPWRKDRHPSFVLFYSDKSELLWTDLGKQETGDTIEFVKKFFSLNYIAALTKLYTDFNLNKTNLAHKTFVNLYKKENPVEFKEDVRTFSLLDLNYWKSYGWNLAMLEYFEVTCIDKLFVNNDLRWIYSNANPIYKFSDQGSIKYYRPRTPKKNRWLGNKSNIIQGLTQLPEEHLDNLIITKSRKDIGCLLTLGYYAVAPISEGYKFNDEQIELIDKKANNIFTLTDNDKCGHTQAEYLLSKKPKWKSNFITEENNSKRLDISDYYELHGESKSKELLKNFIK